MGNTINLNFKRVYVWEIPVRAFHWINAFSIVILGVTGIIIANPPAILSGAEATNQYWFGTVRVIHFITAYIFILAMIYRFYWSIVGNKYASWRVFFPYNKKGLNDLKSVFAIDILLNKHKNPLLTQISVGHNAMAAIAYSILFVLMGIQAFTGFGLYAENATWWFPKLFDWVVPLLGGDAAARLVHHIVMWFIILVVIVHVYLVTYHDWLEGRGEVSSIFGGYKFVRKERVNED